jgi:hypothetical protein
MNAALYEKALYKMTKGNENPTVHLDIATAQFMLSTARI